MKLQLSFLCLMGNIETLTCSFFLLIFFTMGTSIPFERKQEDFILEQASPLRDVNNNPDLLEMVHYTITVLKVYWYNSFVFTKILF